MILKAKIADAVAIRTLIDSAAKEHRVLERSLNYIYENIRDYWIYQEKGKTVGCCALHVVGWKNLGEIKSLVLSKNYQHRGRGSQLVKVCLKEAKALGIKEVFALTFIPDFFAKEGFKPIRRKALPHKIWSDCVNCVFFPNCKEKAVSYRIK